VYLIDFITTTGAGPDRQPVLVRYLPCPCVGTVHRCEVCSGSGFYPVAMTQLGVLISDRLHRELSGQLGFDATAVWTVWPQRLYGALARLRLSTAQHQVVVRPDGRTVQLLTADLAGEHEDTWRRLERLILSAGSGESLLSSEAVYSP